MILKPFNWNLITHEARYFQFNTQREKRNKINRNHWSKTGKLLKDLLWECLRRVLCEGKLSKDRNLITWCKSFLTRRQGIVAKISVVASKCLCPTICLSTYVCVCMYVTTEDHRTIFLEILYKQFYYNFFCTFQVLFKTNTIKGHVTRAQTPGTA